MPKPGPRGRPRGKTPPPAPESSPAQGLSLTKEELQDFVDCIEIPILLLDEDLSIKSFTRPAEELLEVRHEHLGRSIAEIANHLVSPLLEVELRQVLRTEAGLEQEVDAPAGGATSCALCPIAAPRTGSRGSY